MDDSVALRRYLERHIEAGLPPHPDGGPRWQQVLVLPAYRESPNLLDHLRALPGGTGRSLVILVLNRPDRDADASANRELRSAIQSGLSKGSASPPLLQLNADADLLLLDLETLRGPTPASQGVGLARKAGCDLALRWMAGGVIGGEWICCTDADATLPGDYFARLDSVGQDAAAVVFPFQHVPGDGDATDAATALYELRLHHHVLGLEHAGSPYAFHALGSCLAVRADAYARVRGFPKRAGAEDFYLLNKLAKLGPVARLPGSPIRLRSRLSSRVPFGTGPAVQAIAAAEHPTAEPVFYHPLCYAMLRALLDGLDDLFADPGQDLDALLRGRGLPRSAAESAQAALLGLGLAKALDHCRRQGSTQALFRRHFHQWFDGFLSLKFIHALRDSGWPMQSLSQLEALEPRLWPSSRCDIEDLRADIARHWGWR